MKNNLRTKILGAVLGLSITGGATAGVLAQSKTAEKQIPQSEQSQTMRQNKDTPDNPDAQKQTDMQKMMKNCMKMMKMMENMDMKDGSMMKMDGDTDGQKNTEPKTKQRQ